MSSRKIFTDSKKWIANRWFRELEPHYKLFYFYIHDMCDHAGFWEVDLVQASFHIGYKYKLGDWEEQNYEYNLEELKEQFHEQILELEEGAKWWLWDFCILQTARFLTEQEKNPAYKSSYNLLRAHGVYDIYVERYKRAFPGLSKGLA